MARKPGGGSTSFAVSAKPRLGVVVVDPLHVVRAGLALLIQNQPDMEVLAQSATGDEGVQDVRRIRRRDRVVVLVGLGIVGQHDAYWLIRAIRERCPSFVVLACGSNAERTAISRALFVGADGFVDHNAEPDTFLDALRRAARGEVVLTVPRDWLGPIARGAERNGPAAVLTVREREVLSVAAEGLTARQIGNRLGMRERTVTTHLGHIYDKLGVASRVEAITVAARAGLVSLIGAAQPD